MYCYTSMPFGLKNVDATFQRCMQHVFGDLVRRLVEAYMDNIIVKSKLIDDLVSDLTAVFKKLRLNNVKINPKKCVFRVPRGSCLDSWFQST